MTVANLFARIGIKTEGGDKMQQFQMGLSKVAIGAAAAITAAIALATALKKVTDETFKAALALKQFNSETGASMQDLQRWKSIADAAGVSGDAVASSIKAIVDNQTNIKLGQGNISGYQLLGINPNQDPFKILEDLRVKTQGLSQGMKKNMLGQIGVSSELIQVLDMTNTEFNRLKSNAYVMNPESVEQLNAATRSGRELMQTFDMLKNELAAALAPSIAIMNKEINAFIKEHGKQLMEAVKTIFGWVTRFTGAIFTAYKMIGKIIEGSIGMKNALMLVKGALVMIGLVIMTSPFGMLIGGIMLLILVLEDLYVYTQGKGKSMIGELLGNFPQLGEGFKEFKEFLSDIGKLISAIFSGDKAGIDKYIKKLGIFGLFIQILFTNLKLLFSFIGMMIEFLIIKPLMSIFDLFMTLIKLKDTPMEKWGSEMMGFVTRQAAQGEDIKNKSLEFGGKVINAAGDLMSSLNIIINGEPTDQQIKTMTAAQQTKLENDKKQMDQMNGQVKK